MYNFFPPAHQAALANSLPGSTISTDMFGTTMTLPRTFTPCPVLSDHSPSNLIAPGTPFTRLRIAVYSDPHTIFLDKSSVVISVDGACSSNGTPSARAGLGVYFGPGSPYNMSARISGTQTSQRAEIRAAVRGLERAAGLLQDDFSIRRLVVMSDSQYVVQGMTEWVFRWRDNGWKDARGHEVANATDLKELDELIERLAEDGIDVEFWKVDREDNTQADELARRSCA